MAFFHSVHTKGGQCVRRLLFGSTFVAVVSSLITIAIGLWVTITKRNYECLVDTRLNLSVAILLIVFGFFTLLICAGNIYAVRQELRCLLYTVATSFGILSLIFIVIGSMAFVFPNQMQDSLQFGMMSSLKHAYGFKDPETIAWDQLQTEFECCGIDNHSDNYRLWGTSKWFSTPLVSNNRSVPISCCSATPQEQISYESSKICQLTADPSDAQKSFVYETGCFERLKLSLQFSSQVAGIDSFVNAIVLLLPAIFATWVAKLIQK